MSSFSPWSHSFGDPVEGTPALPSYTVSIGTGWAPTCRALLGTGFQPRGAKPRALPTAPTKGAPSPPSLRESFWGGPKQRPCRNAATLQWIITVTLLLFGIMVNFKNQLLSWKSQVNEGRNHENTCVKAVKFCDFLLLS